MLTWKQILALFIILGWKPKYQHLGNKFLDALIPKWLTIMQGWEDGHHKDAMVIGNEEMLGAKSVIQLGSKAPSSGFSAHRIL